MAVLLATCSALMFGVRDYLGGRASRSSSFAVVLTAGLAGSAVVGTFLAVGSTPLPSETPNVVLGLGLAPSLGGRARRLLPGVVSWRDDRSSRRSPQW
ncbi:MAG: hypothetical protein R2705_17285 [Ilumatobacteraceae bacterium]